MSIKSKLSFTIKTMVLIKFLQSKIFDIFFIYFKDLKGKASFTILLAYLFQASLIHIKGLHVLFIIGADIISHYNETKTT